MSASTGTEDRTPEAAAAAAATVISRPARGPVALYLRAGLLAFDRLPFSGVVRLVDSVQAALGDFESQVAAPALVAADAPVSLHAAAAQFAAAVQAQDRRDAERAADRYGSR